MKKTHIQEFAREFRDGNYQVTEHGVVFPRQSAIASGVYFDSVNGEEIGESTNLIVDQGLLHILGVTFGATSKSAAWYIALFSGAVTPAANWTAANFAATASEITSNTEGYSNATRPQFVAGTPAANSIDNLASEATFNIVCTTSINVNGAALLNDNAKGGTSGVLASATRYGSTRVLYNGDVYKVGYKVSLTG